MPVVKANAYGHGLNEVAMTLAEEGARILGVATIEEGIELRLSGITIPILILGSIYPMDNFEAVIQYNLMPVIASSYPVQILEEIAQKMDKTVPFHLEVDTGMGRTGLSPETAVGLWNELLKSKYLKGEGIFTHFAQADEDSVFTEEQIKKFKWVIDNITSPPEYIHAANTAGLLNFKSSHWTLVRPGLAIYGLLPQGSDKNKIPAMLEKENFEPVLSWRSKIIFLKEIKKGTSVSYGRRWIAPRKSKIATICVGYADGYQRVLSNKSQVIIRGSRCPVVGRVCMDMIMVDVSEIGNVSVGDDVILIGSDGTERIRAEDLAGWAQTINYEITSGISSRVPRVFIGE